jgi:N-acetylneuraminic acid mutarotase
MHLARAYGHCFQFNNKVYVFGGRSSMAKKSKKIEVFDLETHQWEILPVFNRRYSLKSTEELRTRL